MVFALRKAVSVFLSALFFNTKISQKLFIEILSAIIFARQVIINEERSEDKVADTLNVNEIIEDFPILKQQVNGKRLAYLDTTATSQNHFK